MPPAAFLENEGGLPPAFSVEGELGEGAARWPRPWEATSSRSKGSRRHGFMSPG